jgi:acetyltransferase-like isoleucine patch superfamily enzyme
MSAETLRVPIERLIRTLKRDDSYRLEGTYATRDLVEVLLRRGRDAVRGTMFAWRVGESRLPLFCGRRVGVRHGHLVSVGQSTIIGDDVLLDGLSVGGLRLGRNVTVGRGSTLTCIGVISRPGVGIRIGDRVGIGEYAHFGGQGGITIGSDVIFGPGVRIFSENHEFDDPDRLIRQQGEIRAPVSIADDCWIGAGVTILAGVSVGTGAIIGSGAVVTRDVPPGTVSAGVPARVIRIRAGSGEGGPATSSPGRRPRRGPGR